GQVGGAALQRVGGRSNRASIAAVDRRADRVHARAAVFEKHLDHVVLQIPIAAGLHVEPGAVEHGASVVAHVGYFGRCDFFRCSSISCSTTTTQAGQMLWLNCASERAVMYDSTCCQY